jgi:uncharacterized membrane protein YqiK
MAPIATAFLAVGGVGLVVLLLSLVFGDADLGDRGAATGDHHRRPGGCRAGPAEAAILDLLVKVLPEVVAAASAPLSAVDKMNVAQGLQLSGDLTGLDVGAMLRRLGKGAADDVESGTPSTSTPAAAVTRVQLDGNGSDPARS